jgi:hypothetical protein
MRLSHIKSTLNGELSFEELKVILSKEMADYLSGRGEKGKSRPIYLDEDTGLFFGEDDLQILVKAFLNGSLKEYEINYIADAILLSNRVEFENEGVADRLGYLTDPEINGPLTKEVAEKLIQPNNKA